MASNHSISGGYIWLQAFIVLLVSVQIPSRGMYSNVTLPFTLVGKAASRRAGREGGREEGRFALLCLPCNRSEPLTVMLENWGELLDPRLCIARLNDNELS